MGSKCWCWFVPNAVLDNDGHTILKFYQLTSAMARVLARHAQPCPPNPLWVSKGIDLEGKPPVLIKSD